MRPPSAILLLLCASAFGQTVATNGSLRISTRKLVDVEFDVTTNRVYTFSTASSMQDRFAAYAPYNGCTFDEPKTIRVTFDTSISNTKYWKLESAPITTNTVEVASLHNTPPPLAHVTTNATVSVAPPPPGGSK